VPLAALFLFAGASHAHADPPPRWRVRPEVSQGFGASRAGGQFLAVFPTRVEVDLRAWRGLSISVLGAGMLTGGEGVCGFRPTAAWTAIGARWDFGNKRGGAWLVPFVEGHVGVGGQRVGVDCRTSSIFPTGGARLGFDVWLGHAAVTVAVAADYLPVAPPITFTFGASFVGM
jgi:hypothetical protein